MSKILYPVGTEVAIRVVSKPVKLIVKSYEYGSHTPYELERADGKSSDHLETARYNVGQLISWKNHKTNKTQTNTQTAAPSLTREDVAQIVDEALEGQMQSFYDLVTELHSHLHTELDSVYDQLEQPINENE